MVVFTQKGMQEDSGIGFGAMSMVAFYGEPLGEQENSALLGAVYDAGCRHFDTAEIYKSGNPFKHNPKDIYSESRLGAFFQTVPRSSFTVATKFQPMIYKGRTDYDTVKASLQGSLQRLQLDFVDLYYCHRIPSLEAAKQFMHTAARLVKEGLVKEVGLSEISGAWLREANAIYPVACVQQEWSLLTRNLEEELIPVCKELNIGVVAYSPLARSLLALPAERPKGFLGKMPRFSEENWAKNVALVKGVQAMAEGKGATASQLSLAWLLAKGQELGVMVLPIPGTTKIANAQSNIAAAKIKLSPEEVRKLEQVGAAVAGARGDESYTKFGIEGQQAKL
mmetsp:Transcript_5987/g.14273  ORF Transcript_5987/g.14273 Transcript_5987/m.14273 type:complete len:337 (+) Transcript_5987:36-1046(+)